MTKNFRYDIFTVRTVNFQGRDMPDPKRLGEMIRFHRKQSRLSQEQLALLGGVGKTVIFDIEKGKLSVRLDTLLKVLKVLNIQILFQSQLMRLFEEQIDEKS